MKEYTRTDPVLLGILHSEFHFDLDACASSNNCCTRYISKADNAFTTLWDGRSVWCSPDPRYLTQFIERAYQQWRYFSNTVVMLLPMLPDSHAWPLYVMKAHEIRILRGPMFFFTEDMEDRITSNMTWAVVVFKHIPGEHIGKGPHTWTWDLVLGGRIK